MLVNSKSNSSLLLFPLNVKCVLSKKMRKTHDLIWESTPLFMPSILSAITHWKIFAFKNVLISDHITNLLNSQSMAFQYSLPCLWPWRHWDLGIAAYHSKFMYLHFRVQCAPRPQISIGLKLFSTLEILGSNLLPRMSYPQIFA